MGAAFFYHLTRGSLVDTLGLLAEKSLTAGWRVEVRGRTDALLTALDRSLWQREGFLPHGMAGGAHDARQPVLLTTGPGNNAAECVMCVEGAEVSADEIAAHARVCILFDGHDPAAVEVARGQWKKLTDAGAAAQYWSEESGRWEMKAESDPEKKA